MYFGQASTGERFRIIGQRGGRRPTCPRGTTTESSGRLGTGQQYVWCHRAPQFAPPARTTITVAPRTTVSPAIQAQVSPQVSPVLTQAQASPGARVAAQPAQVMPGGMTAAGGATGMTAAEFQRILAEQRAADEARRAAEMSALQQAMEERSRILEAQREQERQAMAEREAARVEAQRAAEERAIALPPPPTAGAFVPPSPLMPPTPVPTRPTAPTEIDITEAPVEAAAPVPWLLIAAAGVGAVLILGAGRKRGKRR